jgi:hypothetical protein
LKQRGVTWQRLELLPEDGKWKFQCSIPDRNTPSINHQYLTEKPLSEPLAAIRAVLAQIDKTEP